MRVRHPDFQGDAKVAQIASVRRAPPHPSRGVGVARRNATPRRVEVLHVARWGSL